MTGENILTSVKIDRDTASIIKLLADTDKLEVVLKLNAIPRARSNFYRHLGSRSFSFFLWTLLHKNAIIRLIESRSKRCQQFIV